jgi:hypothetical protein
MILPIRTAGVAELSTRFSRSAATGFDAIIVRGDGHFGEVETERREPR